jgi:hypothetical protein
MKNRIQAKIGTHSSLILVLWNDKPIKKGDKMLAMPSELYDSLHHSYRKLKSCQYWQEYLVTDTEPILFLNR